MYKLLIQLIFLLYISVCTTENFPKVEIEQGILQGKYRKTWKGRTFSSFSGIPYAKPPVGNLRFKAPLPAEPWKGILDASKLAAVCPQMDVFINDYTVRGSEDCLFLNVYTPQLSNANEKPLPVMFHIHGGGFFSGSGNPDLYGPDILLDKDIVLVTINYRLDALGFLSTEDEVLPGNNGLKDQNLALKWVKNNIVHFGGNPEKITIFGLSAGGACIHYHMLSPLSKDLISGAIAHSGIALAKWAFAEKGEAVKNTKKLAEFLDCPTSSSQEIVECLSKVNAYDIVKQSTKFKVYSYDPMVIYKPVVEPDIPGAFLIEDPIDTIISGKSAKIPFITGLTTEDGAIKSAGLYNDSNLIEELNEDFYRLAPIILEYEENSNKDHVSKMIKEFYFGNGRIDQSAKSQLTDLYTDSLFFYPQNAAAQLHAKYSKHPTYYYVFGYHGSQTFVPLFGDTTPRMITGCVTAMIFSIY